jgi:hypothetical protein
VSNEFFIHGRIFKSSKRKNPVLSLKALTVGCGLSFLMANLGMTVGGFLPQRIGIGPFV